MKNFDWCAYTYRHRIALQYVLEELVQETELKEQMKQRAIMHDRDKMFLYLFLEQIDCQHYHVAHQPHHLENPLQKSYEDLVETVLDFESAPYTKPDKPLNAFDFTKRLLSLGYIEQEVADQLFSIMHDFGIDASYDITQDIQKRVFMESLPQVTEEMILAEVEAFLETDPVREIQYIRERCPEVETDPLWRKWELDKE